MYIHTYIYINILVNKDTKQRDRSTAQQDLLDEFRASQALHLDSGTKTKEFN